MAKVLTVCPIELKTGVTDDAVESFFRDPKNERVTPPGMKWYFLKADRGERKGKYAFMLEFDSVETRNRLFPVDGEGISDKNFADRWDPLFAGMDKLLTFSYCDYIDIA